MAHTILLVQFSTQKNSRCYLDYDNITLALDGVCQLYEQGLKIGNPDRKDITYDVTDLFRYVDQLTDLGCLVFDATSGKYTPYNKDWLKKQVFNHLKKQIQPQQGAR
eukprot:Selendium_serpulae@DN2907_c0_g1_i1.p1